LFCVLLTVVLEKELEISIVMLSRDCRECGGLRAGRP
jgi:hypothetical protein